MRLKVRLKEQGFIEVWPSKCVWRWLENKGVFQRAQINASSGGLWIGGIQNLWKPLMWASYLGKTHKDLEWRAGRTKRWSWKAVQAWSTVMWDICCNTMRASQQITTKVPGESTLTAWKEDSFFVLWIFLRCSRQISTFYFRCFTTFLFWYPL